MWNGRCPVCGGTEVYGRAEGVITPRGGALIIRPWRWGFRKSMTLHTLICGACGYVAFQVSAHDLEELRKGFHEGGWVPVRPGG
jgi:hypothetical protein